MINPRNAGYVRLNTLDINDTNTNYDNPSLIREDIKNSDCTICAVSIDQKIKSNRLSFYGHVHQDQTREWLNPHLICKDCNPVIEKKARKQPQSVFAKCMSCTTIPSSDWRKKYTFDVESQSFNVRPAPFPLPPSGTWRYIRRLPATELTEPREVPLILLAGAGVSVLYIFGLMYYLKYYAGPEKEVHECPKWPCYISP